jgi:hypothetical protein
MGLFDILKTIFAFCSLEYKPKIRKIRDNQLVAPGLRQIHTPGRLLWWLDQYVILSIDARWVISMTSLMHWFGVNASVLAVLVTVGIAVLLICCLECSDCSCRDKDDLFHRHEL